MGCSPIVPKKITEEEVSIVENGIRQCARLKHYKIDVRGKTITIYLPDQERDELRNVLSQDSPLSPSKLDTFIETLITYSPKMRFILADEDGRKFEVERRCYIGPDDWLFLQGPDDLSKLVKRYCGHLGKESFYELI